MTAQTDGLGAPHRFEDRLAQVLWDARETGHLVPSGVLAAASLSRERAEAIAVELATAARAAGADQIGWKIGASDAKTRRRLGTTRPFTAPLFSSTLLTDGAVVSLGRLIEPKLEIEIAALLERGRVFAAACIEIIDCRFGNRDLSIGEAIADFGLHAFLMVGKARPDAGPRISATVSHNGTPVVRVSKSIERATSTLRFLSEEQLAASNGARLYVATGSLAEPLPLALGNWDADFGELGRLRMTVNE